MPLVISYYYDSKGSSYYQNGAEEITRTCGRLDIPCYVKRVRGEMSWIEAVRYKPEFIRYMKRQYPYEDLLFLDADCLLLTRPDFKMTRWGVMLRPDGTPHDFVHYIPAGYTSLPTLDRWVAETKRSSDGSHSALLRVLDDFEVIPEGYFSLVIAENGSKRDYFNS